MKPQQLRKKNCTILLLMGLLAVAMLPIASAQEHWPHHSQEKSQEKSDTLYEMVPHIVLPKTIQYKPKPISYSRPWEYVSYTDFPATYTAFPSYVLPYPTEMRSVQQAIYPILPADTSDVSQVQFQYYAPQQFGQIHVIPLASDSMAAMRPILILAVPPVQDRKTPKDQTVPAIPDAIQKTLQKPQSDVNETQNNTIRQVQWANPMPLPPGPAAQNSDSCATNSSLDPAKPLQPTPDLNALAYQGYPQYSTYAQQYAQQASQNGEEPQQNAIGASGLNQDVLKRIEEMLQENPNIQFSAVMMGPNGQLVPIGGFQNPGQVGAGQQTGGGMQMSPEQRTQMLQSQLQYIEAMNRYAQQVYAQQSARHAQFYGIPQSPQYQSPFAGTMYAPQYGMAPYGVNPYAAAQAQNAPAAAGSNDSCPNNNAQQQAAAQQQQMAAAQQRQAMMMQQQMIQPPYGMQLYNPYYNTGYGVAPMMGQYGNPYMLVNPYYPMMSLQTGDGEKSGRGRRDRDRERNLVERFREMRSSQEKKMCEAWRAPHYAEDTGMKVPAKEGYPWGYFGSQVGPQTTPNFGGYHNMYYGHSTYPGN